MNSDLDTFLWVLILVVGLVTLFGLVDRFARWVDR